MSKTAKRIVITAVIILAVIVLTVIMAVSTSNKTRDNSISHMSSIANEQSIMIRDYVKNAEKTLAAYASANEIEELLLEPVNSDKSADAQKYTKKFSATIDGLEGIYASEWNTHVLTHTNDDTVGITTRKDADSLKQLQDAMQGSKDGLYNAGIIISPATGEQIVSIYKSVVYNDQPIGLVGLGIYTNSLVTALNDLELNTSGSTFSMVNVKDKKYIFCNDKESVGKETTDSMIIKKCSEYEGKEENSTEYYESGDNITFCSYISDWGWLLLIESPKSEIFAFSNAMNLNIIVFSAVCIILIIVFNIISIRQDQTVAKLEQSKKKQASITKNLHIAALKDILTDVNNRIKFIDDFGVDDFGKNKVEDSPNSPYCFIMFNLAGFSQVNSRYGHNIGDAALASTADILKEHFGAQNIYRTGSDEFVVVSKCTTNNVAPVVGDVTNVLVELQKPRKLGGEIVTIPYSAAIAKKGTKITPDVLIKLKELITQKGIAYDNQAAYADMDM